MTSNAKETLAAALSIARRVRGHVQRDGEAPMTSNAKEALAAALSIGIHQQLSEIASFADWLAPRGLHHVIEIGRLHGGSTALWHGLSTGKVISIDLPNEDMTLKQCLVRDGQLLAEFPRLVVLLGDSRRMFSYVSDSLDGNEVDLLFIDGDHTYDSVAADYRVYNPFVRSGGVVAFSGIRDTLPSSGVPRFWREITRSHVGSEWTEGGPWGGIGAIVVE